MSLAAYAYYYALRLEARDVVARAMNAPSRRSGRQRNWEGITLASIDESALNYARLEWPKYYSDDTHRGFIFGWERLYHQFKNRPSFFDLAVWQRLGDEDVLQGLALGKPSRAKTHLTLNWVERSFAPTYLRGGILIPVLACAEEYAKLLGCRKVFIKDAVDPAKYERYGYAMHKLPKVSGSYLCKEFDHADQR